MEHTEILKSIASRTAFALAMVAAGMCMPDAPSMAQAPSGAFSAYTADSKQPVDIEAEQLEVDDRKQVAVFRGNVSATQGNFNMRSKELVVTYSASKDAAQGKASDKASAVTSPLGGAGTDIRYIEAKGKVLVTSKGEQTATSNSALFDVAAQTVTLVGDVVVTQGKNIIKGDRLVIDITTGKSTFLMSQGDSPQRQRLKAVFSPKSGDAAADKKPEEGAGAVATQPAPKSAREP